MLQIRLRRKPGISHRAFASLDSELILVLFGQLFLVPLLPAGERASPLSGWLTKQQIVHTYVLVQLGPMDAMSSPNKLPIRPVLRPGMGETRIPRQWNRHTPSIRKLYRQDIFRYLNLCGRGRGKPRAQCRSTHSISPEVCSHALRLTVQLVAIPARRSHGWMPNGREPTRTSPRNHPFGHAYALVRFHLPRRRRIDTVLCADLLACGSLKSSASPEGFCLSEPVLSASSQKAKHQVDAVSFFGYYFTTMKSTIPSFCRISIGKYERRVNTVTFFVPFCVFCGY